MRTRPALPALFAALAVVAVLVRLLGAPAPARGAVLGVFLLLGPGAALVGDPPGWPRLAWWTAVLASSLAIALLVSCALLYAGVWTPDRVLAALVAGVVGSCGARVAATRQVRS
ncbi:MAG: hypothetical protein LC789_00705 [Actinobacteria bacterium]|nr:hypothetical protein [Actinomycetota bacterium]